MAGLAPTLKTGRGFTVTVLDMLDDVQPFALVTVNCVNCGSPDCVLVTLTIIGELGKGAFVTVGILIPLIEYVIGDSVVAV